MPEYLIRTAATHESPTFHRNRNAQMLLPEGWECEPVEGWGDFRMRCGRVEVAFSAEESGWQVVVDGDLPDADAIVAQVTRQVEQAVGEPCEWISLG